jgi:hypothetical protein
VRPIISLRSRIMAEMTNTEDRYPPRPPDAIPTGETGKPVERPLNQLGTPEGAPTLAGLASEETHRRRLLGQEAIEFAERHGLTLNQFADAGQPEREGLAVAEARAVARRNASLIWLDVEVEPSPMTNFPRVR